MTTSTKPTDSKLAHDAYWAARERTPSQVERVELELARAANAHNNREPELVEAHLACALAHAAGDERLVNNIEAARADLVQLAERLARHDELTAVSFAADQAERDGHPILAANLRRACARLEQLMRADKV